MRVADMCDRRIELAAPSAPTSMRGAAHAVPRWGVGLTMVALALLGGGTATAVIASSRGTAATPPTAPSALPATALAPGVSPSGAPSEPAQPATFGPVQSLPDGPPTQVSITTSAAIPSAVPTLPPFGYCGLYVPGKNAQITVEGPSMTDATCAALIPSLHHNVGDWHLVTPAPTSYPTTDVRCDVPGALLPGGDSGHVTDTGTFSTATGDNACADLRADVAS
jgi:hypothetical protein